MQQRKNKDADEKYDIQVTNDAIDKSVGTGPNISKSAKSSAIIAVIAQHFAGATTLTLFEEMKKLVVRGSHQLINQKVFKLNEKGLIEKCGRSGQHLIIRPKPEFYFYFRKSIKRIIEYYEDDNPNIVKLIIDNFKNALDPKPEPETDPAFLDETPKTALETVAESVNELTEKTVIDESPVNNIDQIMDDDEAAKSIDYLVLGKATNELINHLRKKLEERQDKELLAQIEAKDKKIKALKESCLKFQSDINRLEEAAARNNRLLIEKSDEILRVRNQHNVMIDELQKTSNGKISLRQVARISGNLGLSEFRDLLPSMEEIKN